MSEKNATSIQDTGKKVKDATVGFLNKDFGMFKGLHIVCAAVVLLVLVVICMIIASGGKKEVAYSAVYVNGDGDLMLLPANAKADKAVKLVSENGKSSGVTYAHTTDRYVLFTKEGSLYLYDAKSKDKTKKIKSDVDDYYFTENDKYVLFTVDDDGSALYSYDFSSKDPVKLDSDISSIKDYSDNYVVYTKDDSLYIRELKGKKDKEKIYGETTSSVSMSEDGKKVVYKDNEGNLHVYTIGNKKDNKIANEISSFTTNKNATKFYYTVKDGSSTDLYYYNGKKADKVASEISSVMDYNIDAQQVLYTKKDGSKSILYYQKGTKEAAKVADDLEGVSAGFGSDKEIYFYYSDGSKQTLKYAKLSGAKVGKITQLTDDYKSLSRIDGGIIFTSDVNSSYVGTLNIAKNGKAKKIDDDVYTSSINISNNGKKFYYLKNYNTSKYVGDLYVSSGSAGKKLDTDVYRNFTYVKDNLIYYLKDYSSKGKGDLYRYTGKATKVAEDVSSLKSTPNYYNPDKK